MHRAPPTPDPQRILGFHPDMVRRGEMVPSATPPRRKTAPKIGVAAAGQPRRPRFPPDTDLLHQNTPEVDPEDPNRTGDWEGMHGREGGNTSRSGTPAARRPHGRTLRHAARPAVARPRPNPAALRREEAAPRAARAAWLDRRDPAQVHQAEIAPPPPSQGTPGFAGAPSSGGAAGEEGGIPPAARLGFPLE